MVAKINRGSSLYGAIVYNHDKVKREKGRIIYGHKTAADTGGTHEDLIRQLMLSFEPHLIANYRTEKPILHISLNPDPKDKLTDENFQKVAQDYMQAMGYGDQPYIVYLHEDIARRHIHIISTCVGMDGKKIDDSFEWKRSVEVCRALEEKYHLKKIEDKENELTGVFLKTVDPKSGDIKQQISNAVKTAYADYRFQSFGEFNALLSCYGIEVKQVKGLHEEVPYIGVIYSALDKKGIAVSTPINASRIGKNYGMTGIEKMIVKNKADIKDGQWQPKIKNVVALAMHGSRNEQQFARLLGKQGIDVVFRRNDQGRIYGVTFIDHNAKEVYNGSRLGKEFSANVFNTFWQDRQLLKSLDIPEPAKMQHHKGGEDSLSGLMSTFGIEPYGIDEPEQQIIKRKKRKKKKAQGRSI